MPIIPTLYEIAHVYVPAEYRMALSLNAALPEQAHGAALFADISGFTPLTEALTRALGLRRGAEELPIYLNRVYDALIGEVDRFGGSVIGFAGDAITCWFDDAPVGFDLPVPSGAERAADCALALQAAIQAFAAIPVPGQNPVALALKVSVASGIVRRFLVGDPQTQTIELIAGDTVMRMAAGEHLASKGETIFDQATARQLGARLAVKEWREEPVEGDSFAVVNGLDGAPTELPWPRLDAAQLPVESLRPWMHPPIYGRIAQGQGDFLTELRPATALFLRFGGIDFETDPAAGSKLDAYIRWAQSVLNEHEAILTHPTIGDKGSFLCVSFGAPIAHDDDPQRAAAAALDLLHPPVELNFLTPPQIGISQGTARTGSYGGATRRTYDILGDQVNLAARLMMAAKPGEILVSQRVQQQIASDFELTALPPIAVKGKTQPVAIARLEGRRAGGLQALAAQAAPLVGREPELAQLEAILQNALRGQGQIVYITGPGGIGKSRLAAAFAERAAKSGLRLLAGTCQSTSQDVAYQAWQPIFRSLLNLPPNISDPGAFLETALRDRNPQWSERTPLLGALLGLALPDNTTTAALDARLRYEATQTLAVDLLQACALEQPLLLILDDIHWIDEAGKDLLLAVGRVTAGMACTFVLLERSGKTALDLAKLAGYCGLKLEPLSPAAVTQMIANCLAGPMVPLVPEVVVSQTQGNPYFVEQMVRVMQETGSLVQENGRWLFTPTVINALRDANAIQKDLDTNEWTVMPGATIPTTAIGVPDSVQGVMLARVDRLPEAYKLSLRTASVIGREFDPRLLELAHPASPGAGALAGQLGSLAQGEFIVPVVGDGGGGRYAFAHNALQEVLYNALPTATQEDLHQRVGAALENVTPDAVPQLAYHYARAGAAARPKMLHYLDLAAGQSKANYANQTALNHYRQLLSLEERWPWRKGQAEVLHLLGLRDEEKATLEQAVDAPPTDVARLYFDLHFELAEYAAAAADAERLRALAHAADDWVGEVDSLRQLGQVRRRQGENQAAKEHYQQAQALFANRHELTPAARIAKTNLLYNFGWLLCRLNEYTQSDSLLLEALEVARQERLVSIEVDTLNALGSNQSLQGCLQQAKSYFDAARERAAAVGNRMNQARALINLAIIDQRTKNYSSSRDFLIVAVHLIQAVGDRWNEVNTWNAMGIVYQETGQYIQAEQAFQRALDLSREIGDEEGIMYLMLNQGLVKRDLDNLAEANILLNEGVELAEKQKNTFMIAAFQSRIAILRLMTGNDTDAIQFATKALNICTISGLDTLIPDSLAVLSLALVRMDQPGDGFERANQAVQILDKTGGEGIENPIQDYLFCYQALTLLKKEVSARNVLVKVLHLVQQSANQIVEPHMRQSYLNNVPACRDVLGEARRVGLLVD